MGTHVAIAKLTVFETADDGSAVSMGMEDTAGRPLRLDVPVECLQSLLMTLPGMVTMALKRRYDDDRMRLTYPLDRFVMELAADQVTRILTLSTTDGFAVSFSLSEELCREIGRSEPVSAAMPEPQSQMN